MYMFFHSDIKGFLKDLIHYLFPSLNGCCSAQRQSIPLVHIVTYFRLPRRGKLEPCTCMDCLGYHTLYNIHVRAEQFFCTAFLGTLILLKRREGPRQNRGRFWSISFESNRMIRFNLKCTVHVQKCLFSVLACIKSNLLTVL